MADAGSRYQLNNTTSLSVSYNHTHTHTHTYFSLTLQFKLFGIGQMLQSFTKHQTGTCNSPFNFPLNCCHLCSSLVSQKISVPKDQTPQKKFLSQVQPEISLWPSTQGPFCKFPFLLRQLFWLDPSTLRSYLDPSTLSSYSSATAVLSWPENILLYDCFFFLFRPEYTVPMKSHSWLSLTRVYISSWSSHKFCSLSVAFCIQDKTTQESLPPVTDIIIPCCIQRPNAMGSKVSFRALFEKKSVIQLREKIVVWYITHTQQANTG